DVVRRIPLGAGDPQVEPLCAVMPEIVHGARETVPMLLLIGREVQFGLDPVDVGIAVGDDLFGRELRRAALRQDRNVLVLGRVLGLLGSLSALAGLGALGILVLCGALLLGVPGSILRTVLCSRRLAVVADS